MNMHTHMHTHMHVHGHEVKHSAILPQLQVAVLDFIQLIFFFAACTA